MSENPNVTRFFSQREKDMLFDKVLEQCRHFIQGHDPGATGLSKDPRMYCGVLSAILSVELKAYGLNALFEAGTASWRMVPPEKDDGVGPTHFTHLFNEKSALVASALGVFPEVHCWVVLPRDTYETSEVIDFTVGILPQKIHSHGFKWLMPDPPKYLWAEVRYVSKDWHYTGNSRAATIAGSIVRGQALKARQSLVSRG